MRVSFDHNVPRQLRLHLRGHLVQTAQDRGWDTLANGDRLRTVQRDGFELFVSCDKDFDRYAGDPQRTVALLLLNTNHKPSLMAAHQQLAEAVERAVPGSFEWLMIARTQSPGPFTND